MIGNAIIEDQRKYITINEQGVENVKSTDFPGTYPGYDDVWSTKKFVKNTQLDIFNITDTEMTFDLTGVDVSMVNVLRRVVMSEVPSMAIDRIDIANNTSVIHDEHLAHMLGLIPIRADPRYFQFRPQEEYGGPEEYPITRELCIGFKLTVKCARKSKKNDECVHSSVYSGDLKWFPIDGQAYVGAIDVPRPVDDDILIAKLAPGQEIKLVCYCYKDVGRTHAKFMPTCLFNFVELPEIRLRRRVLGRQARRLQALFSDGVIGVEENEDGEEEAKVLRSRDDLLSRNVFYDDSLKDAVSIKMRRDHFMFDVETLGQQDLRNLVEDSFDVIITRLDAELTTSLAPHPAPESSKTTSTAAEKHKFKPKKKAKS